MPPAASAIATQALKSGSDGAPRLPPKPPSAFCASCRKRIVRSRRAWSPLAGAAAEAGSVEAADAVAATVAGGASVTRTVPLTTRSFTQPGRLSRGPLTTCATPRPGGSTTRRRLPPARSSIVARLVAGRTTNAGRPGAKRTRTLEPAVSRRFQTVLDSARGVGGADGGCTVGGGGGGDPPPAGGGSPGIAGGMTATWLGGMPAQPAPGVASTHTSTLLEAIAAGGAPGPPLTGPRAFRRCQPVAWKITVALPSAAL